MKGVEGVRALNKFSLERSLKAKSLGVNIQDHNESAISTPTIIGY